MSLKVIKSESYLYDKSFKEGRFFLEFNNKKIGSVEFLERFGKKIKYHVIDQNLFNSVIEEAKKAVGTNQNDLFDYFNNFKN